MSSPYPHIRVEYLAADGSTWVNMTDALTRLEFARGNTPTGLSDDLEIGDFSCAVRGSAFAPGTNPRVRPRTPIRVRGHNGTSLIVLWSGVMGLPITNYTDKGVPVTTIPGFDVIGVAGEATSYAPLQQGNLDTRLGLSLNNLDGDIPVNRVLVGADDPGGNSFTSYFFETPGTKLDHWKIIRDSKNAWLWAARDRVGQFLIVNARSSSNPPGSPTAVHTFSDTYADSGAYFYTDLTISHDAGQHVNAVNISVIAEGGSNAPGDYGTYVDKTSTDAGWPRRHQSVTITDWSGSSTTTNAARDLMSRYPLPGVSLKTIRHDVMRDRTILANDLIYQSVRVKHAPTATNSVLLVARERHTVLPDRWDVEFDLRPRPTFRSITLITD